MAALMLFLGVSQLILYRMKHCLGKALFFSVLGGAFFLFLLSYGEWAGAFSLPLTEGTLAFSLLTGLPGVVALLLGKMILMGL